jgi:hypothetical protein
MEPEKGYLVVLANLRNKTLTMQVTNFYKAFNIKIEVNPHSGCLAVVGFAIPTLSDYNQFSVYGDTDTALIAKVTRSLPKIIESSETIADFIQKLAKRFKLNHYQLNVNSNFSYEDAKPLDLNAIVSIVEDIKALDFPVNL